MKNTALEKPGPSPYWDKILRWAMAVIAAHYIVVNGSGESIFQLLQDPGYYTEMLFSTLVALILTSWINYISNVLDRKHGWEEQTAPRVIIQFLLGICVPALLEYIFIALYFYILKSKNVLDLPFMRIEYRIVVLMLCFFNLYCIARYFYYKFRMTEAEFRHYKRLQPLVTKLHELRSNSKHTEIPEESNKQLLQESTTREIFIVNTTLKSIPVPMDDICYFYRNNGLYYLRARNQHVDEAYIIPQTLKEVEDIIDPVRFFRINRRMIVRFKSCKSFRPGKGKTLELIIDPRHVDMENGNLELTYVTVSEDRVHAFKVWMER